MRRLAAAFDAAACCRGKPRLTKRRQGAALQKLSTDILVQNPVKEDRVYTITYQARDASGNVGIGTAIVTVPHDQGH